MKLYFSPGACSMSPHIALREAGIPVELVQTSLKTHTTADGSDFYAVTPKGQVPVLELADGTRLTEGAAIVQYIADQAPALAPAPGSIARYRMLEWLNYIATELHKGFGPLFNPALTAQVKEMFAGRLKDRLAFVDRELEGQDYLLGAQFSVADGYLFTVLTWAEPMKLDLSLYKNLQAFRARMLARPAVQATLKAEGLLQ